MNDAPATARLALQVRLALYAAAATLLFVLERLLPNPLPWVRLGLANVVTLIVLLLHGPRAASAVLILRLLLGGLLTGSLFGPQFLLAASGGLASLSAMTVSQALLGRLLSPLGVSVLGASAHAVTQILVVAVGFGAGSGILTLLPLFLALALVSGAVIGVLADVLVARLDSASADGAGAQATASQAT